MKSGAGQLRFSLPHHSSHDPHQDLDHAIADSSAAQRRYTLSSQGRTFCTQFKEVQRLKTQLDQYTDLTEENKASIQQVLPEDHLRGVKGQ